MLPGQTVSDVMAVAWFRPAGSDRALERGWINRYYVAVTCRSSVFTFRSSVIQTRPEKSSYESRNIKIFLIQQFRNSPSVFSHHLMPNGNYKYQHTLS